MPLTNFPNGVTSYGVPVVGSGQIPTSTGTYFFVDSNTGSSGNTGLEPSKPLATIDSAINKCTADKGDVIVVMPNHAENVSSASAITLDVAGVSIIGLGQWASKPTLTYTGATTATVVVSAANCRISNLNFACAIDDLAAFIVLSASGQVVDNCNFSSSGATLYTGGIQITTTYDNILIYGCEFLQATDPDGTGAAAGTGCVYLVDSENVVIKSCRFRGQFESGIVHNKTTAAKGLIIDDCELSNELTVPLLLTTTTEGVCANCYGATLIASDATEAQVWGTIGTIFWIDGSSTLGNDSGGGGQLAVPGTAACS